jgi:hypothetical protein
MILIQGSKFKVQISRLFRVLGSEFLPYRSGSFAGGTAIDRRSSLKIKG